MDERKGQSSDLSIPGILLQHTNLRKSEPGALKLNTAAPDNPQKFPEFASLWVADLRCEASPFGGGFLSRNGGLSTKIHDS